MCVQFELADLIGSAIVWEKTIPSMRPLPAINFRVRNSDDEFWFLNEQYVIIQFDFGELKLKAGATIINSQKLKASVSLL